MAACCFHFTKHLHLHWLLYSRATNLSGTEPVPCAGINVEWMRKHWTLPLRGWAAYFMGFPDPCVCVTRPILFFLLDRRQLISANVCACLQRSHLHGWSEVANGLVEILVSLTVFLRQVSQFPRNLVYIANAHSRGWKILEKQTYHLSGWNHWALCLKVRFPSSP